MPVAPSSPGAIAGPRDARTAQLLQSQQALQGALANINSMNRTALETEELAYAAMGELTERREQIQRVTGSVQRVDDSLTLARGLTMAMSRRLFLKKAALWFMIVLLLATLGIVIYFLLIKKR